MKKISVEEARRYMLDLSLELHRICTENGIPYYMAFGTMLGAIRHKGFIPWDDDMDFIVPCEYRDKFVEAAKNLAPHYRLLSRYNTDYPILFLKIEDTRTEVHEVRRRADASHVIGINIDIFFMSKCTSDCSKLRGLFRKKHVVNYVLSEAFVQMEEGLLKRCLRRLIRMVYNTDKDRQHLLDKVVAINEKIAQTGDDARIQQTQGAYSDDCVIPCEVYGTPTLYKFEDIELYGPQDYDKYLSVTYGDYMKLPPEGKREYHSDGFYLKE